MKVLLLLSTLAFLFVSTGCPGGVGSDTARQEETAVSPALDGNSIVSEFLKRDAAPMRRSKARLTVEQEDGKTQTYVLEAFRRQTEAETRTFTRVIEPQDDSDIASLTIERPGEPAVNVTYVATQGRFRETGTGKMFFGGLTTQELLGEWDKYSSELLSEKTVEGRKMYEVESTLKEGRDSVIYRIVTLFDAETYLPTKLELFNSTGKLLRTFEVEATAEFDGRPAVSKTVITNHIHRTKITVEQLELEQSIEPDPAMFEKEFLKTRLSGPQE
ncbi:MAG: outer membrane lipoprotein-sorting protein [Acidobacteriota bacterium]|nr:MAG: outer membrane lipoprotein-sorting protein [Acidobacteriota bacterium]